MDDQQADERDEHDLRAGEPPRLDLVAAHELDPEAEQAVGEQVRLERVAPDRQQRPAGDDQAEGSGVEADLVQHARVHRPAAARQRGKAAAASGETVMPHGRSVGVPRGSSARKQPTRPIASASGMAAA